MHAYIGRLAALTAMVSSLATLGNAQASFPSFQKTLLPTGGVFFPSVAAGDQNGDGFADIVIAGPSPFFWAGIDGGQAAVMFSMGASGAFGAPVVTSFPGGSVPPNYAVQMIFDVVDVAGNGTASLFTFVRETTYHPGPTPWNETSLTCWTGVGDATGAFHAVGPTTLVPPTTNINVGVEASNFGDLNGDGAPDVVVVVATSSSSTKATLFMNGGGVLGAASSFWVNLDSPTLADLDGDGTLDLFGRSTNASGGDKLSVLKGVDPFTESLVFVGPLIGRLLAGDLDGDGAADVVAVMIQPPSLAVLHGTVGGSLSPPVFSIIPMNVGALADMNQDGLLDLVGLSQTGMGIALGKGSGQFSWPVSYAENFNGEFTIADVNNDGSPDVVCQSFEGVKLLTQIASVRPYGTGTPGCDGDEHVVAKTSPIVGNPTFILVADHAPPAKSGILVIADVADVAGSDPWSLGVSLHVDLLGSSFVLGVPVTSNSVGTVSLAIPIPNDPALAGTNVFAQSIWLWPAASCASLPFGLSASSGLSIVVQP